MKKSNRFVRGLAVSASFALAALTVGVAAHAAKKVNAKDMTCEEFLALGHEVQPRVVYWLEGYSVSGKPEAAEIDVDALERPVTMVVADCRAAPKATLWEKIKKHL
jgi:hypothetical protein